MKCAVILRMDGVFFLVSGVRGTPPHERYRDYCLGARPLVFINCSCFSKQGAWGV